MRIPHGKRFPRGVTAMSLTDRFSRPLRDLRISVTDRCNFRCHYCMPADRVYRFLPRARILTLEEIATVARIAAGFGVRKLRITGGEPLLRRNLVELVAMLARIETVDDLALTTNGVLLPGYAKDLAAAGLKRVTVSLDSLDVQVFQAMGGTRYAPEDALAGMRAAVAAGLEVKVNAVIQRGVNEDAILPLARFCRKEGYTLRFIELMDVGNLNDWDNAQVVSAAEILTRLGEVFALDALPARYTGEVARRYRYRDGGGEIGLIASVTQPFCGGCNRARLSADGHLYTCLFTDRGHDLKTPLRTEGEAAVAEILTRIWSAREDRYSELRASGRKPREKVEMYHIGG